MKYIRASEAQIQLPREIDGLQGREVVDRDGDRLGTVIDILIDRFHHEQSFIEIETDGFLGIGRKHLLAPMRWDEAAIQDVASSARRISRQERLSRHQKKKPTSVIGK